MSPAPQPPAGLLPEQAQRAAPRLAQQPGALRAQGPVPQGHQGAQRLAVPGTPVGCAAQCCAVPGGWRAVAAACSACAEQSGVLAGTGRTGWVTAAVSRLVRGWKRWQSSCWVEVWARLSPPTGRKEPSVLFSWFASCAAAFLAQAGQKIHLPMGSCLLTESHLCTPAWLCCRMWRCCCCLISMH